MTEHYDIVIIGAGPAGMAAAQTAARHKAKILILDEQAAPGGQIYRASETNAKLDRPELGESYQSGLPLVHAFRESDVSYVPNANVWQLSEDREVGYSKDGIARMVTGKQVIVASGAQERPFPVPGWTLPGVMTVGAAQILLKESEIGIENAVFCGSGPLLYLVVHQYLMAGIPVKAVIDLQPVGNYFKALLKLPGALASLSKIIQGWGWKRDIVRAGVPLINGVSDLRISEDNAANGVEYYRAGRWHRLDSEHVLLHQGVVPNINISRAAGCDCQWNAVQCCWNVVVDDWFESSLSGIAVAGDGAFIGGGVAAEYSGCIAALGALAKIRRIDNRERDRLAHPIRAAYTKEMRLRPFIDALFKPAKHFRIPKEDDVVVCRCEEISVAQLREVIDIGCPGPNQLKSFSRCGMGPCQGRFCGLTVSELIADITGKTIEEVGYYRLRSPIKPLRLGELANLNFPSED